jgi:copper chaperone CopZ
VQSSKASFKDGTLEVEYDEAKTSVAAIQQAVTAAGFPSA